MTEPSETLIKNSVTADDYERSVHSGGVGAGDGFMHILIGDRNMFGNRGTGLPDYWTPSRDAVLLGTPRMCSIWGSAVNKAITKIISPGFHIEDSEDKQRRTESGQRLFNFADNSSWMQFGFRHLQDVYCTDNGGMIEIVRQSSARGAKILGIMHLDTMRVRRTGFPDYPALYYDDYGREHAIRADDILMYSDMPSSRATLHGIGLCAADRTFDSIVKLASLETYFREKVTGSRTLAIHIVSGLSKSKLQQALRSVDQEQEDKGFFVYKGSVVIPTTDVEKPPSLITIPLAEIPDGFEVSTERDAAYLDFVNSLGIALQDIKPLSGQGLGTGAQTVILDEAAEGMGPGAAWRSWWQFVSSFRLLATTTTFHFSTNDIRDQKAKAEVAQLRATTRQTMVVTGEITTAQALNMAVDAGDAPKEFLPDDETPGGTLDSDEKPDQPNSDEGLIKALLAQAPGPATVQPIPTLAQAQQARQSATQTNPAQGITKSMRNTLGLAIDVIERELQNANVQLA